MDAVTNPLKPHRDRTGDAEDREALADLRQRPR
jgi:hypothetical protein